MPGYDPAARRPPPVPVVDDDPAPVDALIDLRPGDGSHGAAEQSPPAAGAPAGRVAPPGSSVPPMPAPDPRTQKLAIVGGVAAATLVAIALFARRRRR